MAGLVGVLLLSVATLLFPHDLLLLKFLPVPRWTLLSLLMLRIHVAAALIAQITDSNELLTRHDDIVS